MSSSEPCRPLSPGSCCRITSLPVLSPGDLTRTSILRVMNTKTSANSPSHGRRSAVALSTTGYRRRGQIHRRHRLRLVSVVATRCPEPPPRPAPGWVEAPICQSRSTGVAWRPDEASGRHSRPWTPRGGQHFLYAHILQAASHRFAVYSIPIADQRARRLVKGECLTQLPCDPRGVGRGGAGSKPPGARSTLRTRPSASSTTAARICGAGPNDFASRSSRLRMRTGCRLVQRFRASVGVRCFRQLVEELLNQRGIFVAVLNADNGNGESLTAVSAERGRRPLSLEVWRCVWRIGFRRENSEHVPLSPQRDAASEAYTRSLAGSFQAIEACSQTHSYLSFAKPQGHSGALHSRLPGFTPDHPRVQPPQ
jgi:hypothetical protein